MPPVQGGGKLNEPAVAEPSGSAAAPLAAEARNRLPVAHLIEPTILRLEEIIDQETEALKTREPVDLKSFNDRKSQALLELTRLLRQVQGGSGSPALMTRMDALKEKLEINRAMLKMHLEAVREIADTVSEAIRNAESDGTYSPNVRAPARRQ